MGWRLDTTSATPSGGKLTLGIAQYAPFVRAVSRIEGVTVTAQRSFNEARFWYALGESNPSLHRERVPS